MHTIPHAVQDIPLGEGSDFKDEMLGLTRYALALSQFIVQCGTPMTIAIQGDWGTGKTSMMRLIESTLATDETVKVGSFWFNTWQYSQFSSNSSLLPLIFLESLTRQLKQRLDEKSSDMLKKVQGSLNTLKPFLFAAGRGVAYAATGGIATEVYDEARKQGGVGNTSTLALSDALSNLKRDLTMYVEKICVDEGLNRIVIFIDDLDRIRPESAIELLETLKLFVDIPKCVFVLALDISVVKKGVSAKFGTDEVDAEGRSFFDKIIQLPFQMPTVTYGAHIKTYLTRLLERSNYGNGMSDEGLTTCANLLITSIGTNPRSIKRLINVLSLMSISHNLDMSEDKLDLDGDEHNQLLLFGFTCFQIAYEPLFSLIYRTESLDFLLLDSLDWDNHEEDPHLTEFIRLMERAEADNKQPEAFLTLLASVVDEDGSGDFDDAEMHKVKRIAQGLQLTSVDDDDSSYSSSRAGTDEDRKNAISSYFSALLDDITQETFDFLIIPTLPQSKIKRDGDTTRFKIVSKAKTTNYSNAAFSFAISDTARVYDYPDTMSLVCEITVEDGDNIMMQYASGRRKAHRALNDICSEMEAVASQYEIDVHAHAYKSIIVIEKVIELTDDVERDHHEVKQGLFELDQCLSELLGVEQCIMSDLERVQFFYDNGNIEYVGTVHPVTQQFHGKGVLFAEEGHLLYVGEFAEGDFEGEGTAYFPNGIKFSEGTWVDNKLHGKGKVYDEQGKLGYEGYLKDNRPCARRDVENPEEWAKVEDVKASHKALETLMEELDAFIGLGAVKKEIKSLINLVKVQKIRREHDLPELSISLHMVLTGNPGTGKTTIARQIASILGTLGVLSKGHMVETDRSGLVAGFVGQTGIKVTDIVDEATGGVLFIDEAYALVKDDRDQYGEEAIATLLKLMEDRRDDLVVIMAGYQKEMNAMLQVNPGLASRFNRFIDFPDYNANELLSISDLICKQSGYALDDNARQFLTKVYNIAISRKKKNFANGRLARNLFERAIIHQSNRIISENANSELALTTIQVEDIKAVLKNKEIQL